MAFIMNRTGEIATELLKYYGFIDALKESGMLDDNEELKEKLEKLKTTLKAASHLGELASYLVENGYIEEGGTLAQLIMSGRVAGLSKKVILGHMAKDAFASGFLASSAAKSVATAAGTVAGSAVSSGTVAGVVAGGAAGAATLAGGAAATAGVVAGVAAAPVLAAGAVAVGVGAAVKGLWSWLSD